MNLCSQKGGFSLGRGSCNPEVGFATAFILSAERKVLAPNTPIKQQIQSWINDGSAFMLTGMDEREANNEEANVHSFASGRKTQISPAKLSDNFDFLQDFCKQKLLAKLVGFEGFFFAITNKGQLLGDKGNILRMSPVSIDSMNTTGIFKDNANAQVDTLTFTYGALDVVLENRKMIALDFDVLDIRQPRELELEIIDTTPKIRILEACLGDAIPEADPLGLSLRVATINGTSTTSAVITAGQGGVFSVELDPKPKSGQTVTLQLAWEQDKQMVGVSALKTFVVA
ncbi:MAG: hypothetical protein FWC98_02870 [Bacteroidales bacterium]|nr:hypothetical protein [Bacteroidales bacterium]